MIESKIDFISAFFRWPLHSVRRIEMHAVDNWTDPNRRREATETTHHMYIERNTRAMFTFLKPFKPISSLFIYIRGFVVGAWHLVQLSHAAHPRSLPISLAVAEIAEIAAA